MIAPLDAIGRDREADLLALQRGAVIGLDDFEADLDGGRRGSGEEEEDREERRSGRCSPLIARLDPSTERGDPYAVPA